MYVHSIHIRIIHNILFMIHFILHFSIIFRECCATFRINNVQQYAITYLHEPPLQNRMHCRLLFQFRLKLHHKLLMVQLHCTTWYCCTVLTMVRVYTYYTYMIWFSYLLIMQCGRSRSNTMIWWGTIYIRFDNGIWIWIIWNCRMDVLE